MGTSSESQAVAVEEPASDTGAELSLASGSALDNQKIIQNVDYTIETLTFDDSVKKVEELCEKMEGYIEESRVQGSGAITQNRMRSASFVLRIPAENLNSFDNTAAEIGSVVSVYRTSENITEQYFDKESRLKSLRTQQERLLELMEGSGTLADLIELESALADVNYQIEQLTGELRQYDSLVDFSTVTIELQEVVEPTEISKIPMTLGEKINRQFQNSISCLLYTSAPWRKSAYCHDMHFQDRGTEK